MTYIYRTYTYTDKSTSNAYFYTKQLIHIPSPDETKQVLYYKQVSSIPDAYFDHNDKPLSLAKVKLLATIYNIEV